MIQDVALPLLSHVAAGDAEEVWRPVARVVRALASTGHLPPDALEDWAKRLLRWARLGAGDPVDGLPASSDAERKARARVNRAVVAALQSASVDNQEVVVSVSQRWS